MKLADQNILYIARAPIHGGTENVVLQLCKIFKPQVNKIVVCAGAGFDQEALKKLGIKFYLIPDLTDKSPKSMLQISSILKHVVKNEEITVIHTHHRMAAFYVTLLGLYKKCYFINTSHNTFDDKIKLTQFSYKHANLIACGEMVKKNLQEVYGLRNVTVVHNAIESFRQPITEEPVLRQLHDEGYYLIGNVGRLSEQKGFKYFLDSIPLVLEKHPKTKFIIIGAGELEQELKDQAKRLQISDSVIWLGYRKDVQNLLSQLDLVVLSSLWEGLPLTPLEAFSVGTPVVGTAVDGTPEEIQDGYNGYLAKPKDSKDLAGKILLAINQNAKKTMYEAIQKVFDEEFSFDVFAKNMSKYYQKL